jgi:hypothetical protein
MNEVLRLKLDIASSLFSLPCEEDELFERDFLKNKSRYGLQRVIQMLESDGALYYKNDVMHIKKSWAKKNLKEYGHDFRTDREKWIDSLSDFKKQVYGLK